MMKRLRICKIGSILLILFCLCLVVSIGYLLWGYTGHIGPGTIIEAPGYWIGRTAIIVLTESVIFWAGIIMVYLTSAQLGLRYRILGIVLGWIPIANLIMLFKIISVTLKEVCVETRKIKLNEARKEERICATKYPILMVHGVFFRDFEHLNYWGRIPGELTANGAVIYYGNHNSAAAVEDSAAELEQRILEIVEETGCEKVNIIAHSKGGLDSRTAIAKTSAGKYVASLTTINTPHRGCEFAEYLLSKIPESVQQRVAAGYNAGAATLGDVDPDFMAAVTDLTKAKCLARNEEVKDDPAVYYQSVGSKLNKAFSGRFPLNFSYHLVKYFDGDNDGLVGEESFPWGERFEYVTVSGKRGVSHGDMIDLNRENFAGFDVREFFVQLVADLKNKGF